MYWALLLRMQYAPFVEYARHFGVNEVPDAAVSDWEIEGLIRFQRHVSKLISFNLCYCRGFGVNTA